MSVKQLFDKDIVLFNDNISSKSDLFELFGDVFLQEDRISDKDKFISSLYARENEVSTGIEDGFGIPHAKTSVVKVPSLGFARTSPIKDYVGFDDQAIEYVFLIAVPLGAADLHLNILSNLSRKLMHDEFKQKIKDATTKEDILDLLGEVN